MKKLLLGTSALVAAGLFSNGALAQTATTDTPTDKDNKDSATIDKGGNGWLDGIF